ncbi:DegT/DnrJ/EryC1/StrS aminotransferase family protein [Gloeocapsa sp. PCC 73106]|uniref:DegT/DnrJ/EryC1/StrS family aminotransferase n=1 Tax=Gloeocapsa sp. PCC 73106 TaxID=102232 RepID=UPI0002AC4C57|nr:DegT/DnrJ/EryC1/StrS family aminotransferase [Gloeocapsa sp. PCC 73106]ELR99627.1 putative PLP-dependent enzyme possibly involved in cell wall biogenesis [Gloeocapsa sp. PCC 73106]
MTLDRIPILDLRQQYQQIKSELDQAIASVLESGQFILGPEVQKFEAEVAEYLGIKYAVGVNSGTDALMIGMRALGIGVGDEVITTPFSFVATAESISNIGAKPVFVDVEAETFNLNPQAIKAQITPQTKAIMPVHLYGRPVAMDHIRAIAREYHLQIIEDCAQSFGARAGQYTGTFGDVGAFSFFPTKNLGAYGDGGLIVTNNPDVAELASMLRVHGSKYRYQNEILGYNSRLDSLQASILRVKLPYVKHWNEQRYQVAKRYNQLLQNIPDLITPELCEGHVFHQYTIRITNGKRDQFQKHLEAKGVSSMVYYPIPQNRLPIYAGQYPDYPVSDLLATQVLSLPIWPEITPETQEIIALALKSCL